MQLLKTKILFLGFVFCILSCMFFLYLKNNKYERYLIYFKNKITNKINVEMRYLIKPETSEEEFFVSELFLGAENHDYYYISQEIRPKSVFIRNKILYVDLPEKILEKMPAGFDFDEFYGLFLKNIFSNFRNIEKIYIFLDGKKVY